MKKIGLFLGFLVCFIRSNADFGISQADFPNIALTNRSGDVITAIATARSCGSTASSFLGANQGVCGKMHKISPNATHNLVSESSLPTLPPWQYRIYVTHGSNIYSVTITKRDLDIGRTYITYRNGMLTKSDTITQMPYIPPQQIVVPPVVAQPIQQPVAAPPSEVPSQGSDIVEIE